MSALPCPALPIGGSGRDFRLTVDWPAATGAGATGVFVSDGSRLNLQLPASQDVIVAPSESVDGPATPDYREIAAGFDKALYGALALLVVFLILAPTLNASRDGSRYAITGVIGCVTLLATIFAMRVDAVRRIAER